jgi:AraC-like DNA-binding protein/uncharacterized cupin superfamily protein
VTVLKPNGIRSGFWALDLQNIIPEIVDCGISHEPGSTGLGPHIHRHWQLVYQSAGVAELVLMGNRTLKLSPGSFYSISPNTNHWLKAGSHMSLHYLFIGLDLRAMNGRYPEWNLPNLLQRPFSLSGVQQFETLFTHVIEEATSRSLHQETGLRFALDRLLLEIVRIRTQRVTDRSTAVIHPAVSRTVHLLQTRFREPWSLHQLAHYAGISRTRLAELFQQMTGSSIHQFQNKLRIQHAESLLSWSDLSVSEIAQECGFATSQHFSRIFKQFTGRPPRAGRTPVSIRRKVESIRPKIHPRVRDV